LAAELKGVSLSGLGLCCSFISLFFAFVAFRAKRCLASPGSWGVLWWRIFFGWRSAIGVPVIAVLGDCLVALVGVDFSGCFDSAVIFVGL
jgi:hypothetical protein